MVVLKISFSLGVLLIRWAETDLMFSGQFLFFNCTEKCHLIPTKKQTNKKNPQKTKTENGNNPLVLTLGKFYH